MKKLINNVKKHYVLWLIIGISIVLITLCFVIIKLIKINKDYYGAKNSNANLYQIINAEKKDIKATVFAKKYNVLNVTSQNYEIYDESPLYYKKSQKLIIPKDMSIVYYYNNMISYKIDKFTTIYNKNGINYVETAGNKNPENYFFLYDGDEFYIFFDDSSLRVNDEYYDVSKYSFVISNPSYVLLYDYKTDSAKILSENAEVVQINLNEVYVDLLRGVARTDSTNKILNRDLDFMEEYKEAK